MTVKIKPYSWTPKSEFHAIFPFNEIFFFLQPLIKRKIILSSKVIPNHAVGSIWPVMVCQLNLITFKALPIRGFYEYAKIRSKSNEQTDQYELQRTNLFTCFLCDENEVYRVLN